MMYTKGYCHYSTGTACLSIKEGRKMEKKKTTVLHGRMMELAIDTICGGMCGALILHQLQYIEGHLLAIKL
jgi:hypothetical protein